MPIVPTLVEGLARPDFFERHAAPGRVGLVAGVSLPDRAIARAQRKNSSPELTLVWTHAFLCEGRRLDGQHWVVESDLEWRRRHIQLGVQENRLAKFHDPAEYPAAAILDFGLDATTGARVLAEALSLVADRTCYSIRELFGTLLALHRPELRSQANRLAQDRSLFCSAFVRHCYQAAGLDLLPGVDIKNTTPDDLSRSPAMTAAWISREPVPVSGLAKARAQLRRLAERRPRG